MTVAKHVHKLRKHVYKKTGNAVFFCILPDCTFKSETQFVLGKPALCNICGCEFIMDEIKIKLQKPHCNNCGRMKIIDEYGRRRFVSKTPANIKSLQTASQEVSQEVTTSLKDRLSVITQAVPDEDIL